MSSARKLTDRQKQVLDFIRREIDDRGRPPTLREIAVAMGIRNATGVYCHLHALKEKGYIDWEDGLSRSIRILSGTSIREENRRLREACLLLISGHVEEATELARRIL